MIKKLTNHTIYEVYNEWVAESILVDHKPTKKELYEIFRVEKWEIDLNRWFSVTQCATQDQFIEKYIHVEKVKKIYINDNRKK